MKAIGLKGKTAPLMRQQLRYLWKGAICASTTKNLWQTAHIVKKLPYCSNAHEAISNQGRLFSTIGRLNILYTQNWFVNHYLPAKGGPWKRDHFDFYQRFALQSHPCLTPCIFLYQKGRMWTRYMNIRPFHVRNNTSLKFAAITMKRSLSEQNQSSKWFLIEVNFKQILFSVKTLGILVGARNYQMVNDI